MIEHDEVSTAIDVRLDHKILLAIDAKASAEFFAEIFGLPVPLPVGHFKQVRLSAGRILDFATPGIDFPGKHFPFAVNNHPHALHSRILQWWTYNTRPAPPP